MKKIFILIALFVLLLCACQKRTSIILSGEIDVESTIALADSAYDREDYETALYYYLQLEDYFNVYGNGTEDQANLYNTIGKCYRSVYDKEMEKKYFEKSAEICEKLELDELNYDNCWHLASLYNDNNPENSDKALKFAKRSEQAAEQFSGKDSFEVGEAYIRQGQIYVKRKEFEKSLIYFQDALGIMEKTRGEESDETAAVYINLGKLYDEMEKYDDAISYLEQAEKILKSNQNNFKLGQAYLNMAEIYTRKKEYEKSIQYCDYCIELYRENNIINMDLAHCHLEKAVAAYYLSDNDMVEKELVESYQVCEAQPKKSVLANNMKSLLKEQAEVYYDYRFKGDKSSGFEAWYQELITD